MSSHVANVAAQQNSLFFFFIVCLCNDATLMEKQAGGWLNTTLKAQLVLKRYVNADFLKNYTIFRTSSNFV